MTGSNWQRIREHLEANGLMTARGSTRAAKPRLCRDCNAPVLIGLDDDTAARDVTVDPEPIDQTGELLALIAGRYTVALRMLGGRLELSYRDAGRIGHRPAASDRFDVLAEHVCGTRPNWPTCPSAFTPTTTTALPPGSAAPF